mgnify:CR=1 FL=1
MLDNVRVVEAPEHFNLSLDLFEDTLQLDFAFVQYFDSHFMVCYLVYGHYRANNKISQSIKRCSNCVIFSNDRHNS